MHIQNKHCPSLRLSKWQTRTNETSTGKMVNFDKNTRNLDDEEVIVAVLQSKKRAWIMKWSSHAEHVPIVAKEAQALYCPYQGCDLTFTRTYNIYKHIRTGHFKEFPMMPKNPPCILTDSLGQRLHLNGILIANRSMPRFD
ncbi:hypothetical protein BJV82DRAFT_24070 [Fennellomyces sp. T-0311]|nr:hypothetical protein BJV82DRAFT_24070 [Fennellomyces sp. T-0311]